VSAKQEGQSKANEQLVATLKKTDEAKEELETLHNKQLNSVQERADSLAADLAKLRSGKYF
jgi:hypothetical protein